MAPIILAYMVGPLAFGALVVLRHFGYVARLSLWAYLAVLLLTAGTSLLVESWRNAGTRSIRLHVRIAIHVAAVTVVIYMTGWGPVLLMAYAFAILEDMEQCGAATWKVSMGWTVIGVAIGQVLVVDRLGAFVSRSQGRSGRRHSRASSLWPWSSGWPAPPA